MSHKELFKRFVSRVNEAGKYYIYEATFGHHFENWIMLPEQKRRFRMLTESEFKMFLESTTAKCAGRCTYAQGIGLDKI